MTLSTLGRSLALAAAVLSATPLASCGETRTPTEPSPAASSLPLELVTDHFRLHHGQATAALVPAYAEALEGSWARITADLSASPGRIEGFLYPDQASYTAATGYTATGSVSGPNRFHLVAVPLATSNAVHEFAHNVALHLAPGSANNPVWLWEAVALFESGQLVPPSSVPSLAGGRFPTLAQLNSRSNVPSVYEVGYTIAELVVSRWGLDGLRRLIVANGDLEGTLGISTVEFEGLWRDFVVTRYLSPRR